MKTLSIWRVENKGGYGPYATYGEGNIYGQLTALKDYSRIVRSVPWKDRRLGEIFRFGADLAANKQYFCGFNSWQQYDDWFATDRVKDLLDDNGFFLARYEAAFEDVLQGEAQVLFVRDRALACESRRCIVSEMPADVDADPHGPMAALSKTAFFTAGP